MIKLLVILMAIMAIGIAGANIEKVYMLDAISRNYVDLDTGVPHANPGTWTLFHIWMDSPQGMQSKILFTFDKKSTKFWQYPGSIGSKYPTFDVLIPMKSGTHNFTVKIGNNISGPYRIEVI